MRLDTFDKLLAMYLLQKANLPTYQIEVGATAQDIKEVGDAADNMQKLKDFAEIMEANKKTVTNIKQNAFNGDMNAVIKPFPTFPVPVFDTPLLAGYLERANRRNKRFKAADGYTKAIGIALGIDEDTPVDAPDTIEPTIDGFPAKSGYAAALVIGNRGKSTMWKVFGRRSNAPKWSEIVSGTGKSADFTIEPTEAGKPEQIELKVQLYKNNEPYGIESDTLYLTLNP